MPTHPATAIETFPNPAPGQDYTIRISAPEFTCLCPKTGQPDFATLELEYVPDRLCIELKTLKLYLWSFRDRGGFHEAVTNEIIEHLASTLAPRSNDERYDPQTARFNVRGGIHTSVVAERRAPQWRAAETVKLP